MKIDKDKLRESITIDEVQILLEEFGASPRAVDDGTLLSRTICHNHIDNNPSHKLYYYDNNQTFMCYTNCGAFDIYDLLIKVFQSQRNEELSFPASVKFLANRFANGGFDFIETTQKSSVYEILELLARIESIGHEEEETNQLKEYDSTLYNNLPSPRIGDWEAEGISDKTIKKFGIKYHPPSQKIVIPHHDKDGRLIGIRGRALIQEDVDRYGKYMPLYASNQMFNHPLGLNLYGLAQNKHNIERVKTAILFEGEKSVLLAEEYMDINIATAICGSNISNFQVQELVSLGVTEIIIAFDRQYKEYGDDECVKWVEKIKRIADRYKNYLKVSVIFDRGHLLGYKDAPVDCGKEVFLELLKGRTLVR